MKKKTQNIITSILGLIILLSAVFYLSVHIYLDNMTMKDIVILGALISLGSVCLRVYNDALVNMFNKFFTKK